MRRGGRALALAAGAALAVAAACTDVSTDPNSVASIVADTLFVPSLFIGDTLRDTSGAPLSLRRFARAYNPQGQELLQATPSIFLQAADTASHGVPAATVVYAADSTPLLVGATSGITATSAVALTLQYLKGLRVNQRLDVVPTPTAFVQDTSTTTRVLFTDLATTSATATFAARALYDSVPQAQGRVRSVLVSFVVDTAAHGARIDSVRFTDPTLRNGLVRLRVDTTDASGVASRSLTVYRRPGAVAGGAVTHDTLRVVAALRINQTLVRRLTIAVPVVDSVAVAQ